MPGQPPVAKKPLSHMSTDRATPQDAEVDKMSELPNPLLKPIPIQPHDYYVHFYENALDKYRESLAAYRTGGIFSSPAYCYFGKEAKHKEHEEEEEENPMDVVKYPDFAAKTIVTLPVQDWSRKTSPDDLFTWAAQQENEQRRSKPSRKRKRRH